MAPVKTSGRWPESSWAARNEDNTASNGIEKIQRGFLMLLLLQAEVSSKIALVAKYRDLSHFL
jgi:hypothetical protein